MTDSWMKKISRSGNPIEMMSLSAKAMQEYSNKIAMACTCPGSDVVFVAAVLKMHADSYAKEVPSELQGFMQILEQASAGAEEIKIKIPR